MKTELERCKHCGDKRYACDCIRCPDCDVVLVTQEDKDMGVCTPCEDKR